MLTLVKLIDQLGRKGEKKMVNKREFVSQNAIHNIIYKTF